MLLPQPLQDASLRGAGQNSAKLELRVEIVNVVMRVLFFDIDGTLILTVATGGVSLEELAAANPDLLVESLSEPAVLKMLLDH